MYILEANMREEGGYHVKPGGYPLVEGHQLGAPNPRSIHSEEAHLVPLGKLIVGEGLISSSKLTTTPE